MSRRRGRGAALRYDELVRLRATDPGTAEYIEGRRARLVRPEGQWLLPESHE